MLRVLVLVLASLTQISCTALLNCSDGCFTYGVCNRDRGRCHCPKNRYGPSCEQTRPADNTATLCKHLKFDVTATGWENECLSNNDPNLCLNGCNQAGTCMSGWCHCKAGFWGADCSLSEGPDGEAAILPAQGYSTSSQGPYIYVYELPPVFNTWYNPLALDRRTINLLWTRILSSGQRTLDASKADFFFIPVSLRILPVVYHETLMQYIQQGWPYWNQTHGFRHLLVLEGDYGRCEVQHLDQQWLTNVTILQHWGLHTPHPITKAGPCHKPDQDVVIPFPRHWREPLLSSLHPQAQANQQPANIFFFAGGICAWKNIDPLHRRTQPRHEVWLGCLNKTYVGNYSFGVRAKVYLKHHNRPGFKIQPSSKTFERDFANSKFCLGPPGSGFGKRAIFSTLMGCIPVVIGDNVHQAFAPMLDWSRWSLLLKEEDIDSLPDILQAVPESTVLKLRANMHCAARHLWWTTSEGSLFGEDGRYDAFATLMQILHARLRHPAVPAEELAQVDEHLRKFMSCELGEDTGQPDTQSVCTAPTHAGRTANPALSPFCPSMGPFTLPGGAVCHGAQSLAHCPRINT